MKVTQVLPKPGKPNVTIELNPYEAAVLIRCLGNISGSSQHRKHVIDPLYDRLTDLGYSDDSIPQLTSDSAVCFSDE